VHIPDPERPFEVETDASDFAIGAVLGQRDDKGRLHPVAFLSRQLHGPELRYPTYDKELMAIVEACRQWRHHLEGSKFQVKVYSDHKNLTYFIESKTLSNRQIR